MEAQFPGAARSYLALRDFEICGGDLDLVRVKANLNGPFWARLVRARKSPLSPAAVLGWRTHFLPLLKRLSLAQGTDCINQQLDITPHVHFSPYAEVAMDVDKPDQLQIVRQRLASTEETVK